MNSILYLDETKMNPTNEVIVTDFAMEFGSMVVFILRWLAASLVAGLILGAVLFGIFLIGYALLHGFMQ